MDVDVTVNDLTGEQKSLAEVVGIEAYIKLVNAYGGSNIYIAKSDKITNLKRDAEIYRRFNGDNYYQLAREYNLSERAVRDIINDEMAKRNSGQMSLWE